MPKLIFFICLTISPWFISCNNNEGSSMQKTTKDIIAVFEHHNNAWAKLKDLNELEKYIHKDIVFVAPPFHKAIIGKNGYLEDFGNFIHNSNLHYFKTIDPQITLFNESTASVTYNIDMLFDYGEQKNIRWQGRGLITFSKENYKWLVTTHTYAEYINE